ncbi:MAG: hypothetical protein JW384_02885 [Nitrosomonadaceae bacterium]|nr:hypothetical protein [Nitrosomonadaceae bacterium]
MKSSKAGLTRPAFLYAHTLLIQSVQGPYSSNSGPSRANPDLPESPASVIGTRGAEWVGITVNITSGVTDGPVSISRVFKTTEILTGPAFHGPVSISRVFKTTEIRVRPEYHGPVSISRVFKTPEIQDGGPRGLGKREWGQYGGLSGFGQLPWSRVFPAFWAEPDAPAGLRGRWAWLGCVSPRTAEWLVFFAIFV